LKTPVLTLRKPPVRELDAFVAASEQTPARQDAMVSVRSDAPASERSDAATSPGHDVHASEHHGAVTPVRRDAVTPVRSDVPTSERSDAGASPGHDVHAPGRQGVVTSQPAPRWKPSRLRRDLPPSERERLTCWLPREVAARLRRAAADQRRAQADLVAEAVERLLG
jgi:hypothetical protein